MRNGLGRFQREMLHSLLPICGDATAWKALASILSQAQLCLPCLFYRCYGLEGIGLHFEPSTCVPALPLLFLGITMGRHQGYC